MLDIRGGFVTIGIPDEPLPGFNTITLLGHGTVFGGSHSASKEECLQILQLAVHKSMKPCIMLLPMSDAQKEVEVVKKNETKGK
jgi:alcohol dehydrogenase (NADP+)